MAVGFDEKEGKRAWNSIMTLRTMRCAGESSQRDPEKTPKVQEVLADAESLAKLHGEYLAHLVLRTQTPDLLQALDEEELRLREKYSRYPQIRKSPYSNPLNNLDNSLSQLAAFKTDVLTDFFIRNVNMGQIEFTELASNNIGILAPLSSDILVASIFPSLFKLRAISGIPVVKPALVSTNLKMVTLPKTPSGEPVFTNMDRVLCFIDAKGTGETLDTLYWAARTEYPGKVITPV